MFCKIGAVFVCGRKIILQQITLAREVSMVGVGLHAGKDVHLTLKPAEAGTGIVFCRADLPDRPVIHATADKVTATVRATTLEENGAQVFTVEHLMSAFHGLKIDNCLVEMDSPEPPVADGSALSSVELIESAGIRELAAPRREIVIDRVYRVDEPGKFVMALPYDGFRVTFTSVNSHRLIGIQVADFTLEGDTYRREIAPARTIAYEKEVQALREMGLGLGGTLENVIVYNDEGWLNPLRFSDELVRHKALDVIGDLRLAGIIRGHVIALASGHALNTRLAKKILAAG
ncbi:MAG: UDP-3-O-[Selenomonadaceae bacterium]|nr:UDP-3-O-[3-hydroxymyristoyl] N-acetylglucosamine deacetylase [Selenomonadaceae bacterium]